MATWIMQKCLIVQPEGKENGRETGGWSVDDEGRLGHHGGYLTCFVLVLAFGVGLGLETKSVCGWAVLGTKYRCLYCVCSCGMACFSIGMSTAMPVHPIVCIPVRGILLTSLVIVQTILLGSTQSLSVLPSSVQLCEVRFST
ncbi:uncharacterized protein CCOS01_02288 [Colletotrichum costaricense]|uniref:Uncharacterized protein n=2 Tax=Colletotrichum acutatum species complex TaxID=2707335 RepID=A0AAI9Z765_9PEZI|nr:uncharacterized protein CCOS01_02288 [Colletotrichum costaricense]XP_060387462.1 uncharacterized protein CTAM01_01888 [Colletotrichum tamarilloi]KAI3541774.1 hypothetical protein CSPX01_07282 [Colletotrichum filicis]KAK1509765.1 hypothetical protein CTAM01_01888 [Colletotrichum tamarilloi]KAK1536968.1 hypothetical protein CCOS01_02288 [Colletotrichum costaricense]